MCVYYAAAMAVAVGRVAYTRWPQRISELGKHMHNRIGIRIKQSKGSGRGDVVVVVVDRRHGQHEFGALNTQRSRCCYATCVPVQKNQTSS